MNILFLVGTLNLGGLERQAAGLCLYLNRHPELNVKADIVCLWKKEGTLIQELENAGVQIYAAPERWRTNFKSWRALRHQFQTDWKHYEVIHSFVNFSLLQQVLAASNGRGRLLCFTERNAYPFTSLQRLNRMVQERVCRFMGVRFSANSHQVAGHLSTQLFRKVSDYPVIPNAVWFNVPEHFERNNFRLNKGFSETDFLILYVARFASHKGQERMLQLLADSVKSMPDLQLVYIGDGPERAKLEAKATDMGLKDKVHFVGHSTEVFKWLLASDLLCLLSDHEGMPNAVLEAMAAGLPVLATETGDLNRLLSPEQRLTLPYNMQEASTRLHYLLSAKEQLRGLGRRNEASVLKFHSFDAQWVALRAFYA